MPKAARFTAHFDIKIMV